MQWTEPDAAVFPQMRGNSSFLVLERPAGQEQVRFSLQEMAQVAGILEDRIDTRSLRRGALRDQAYAKKVIAGVASRATAMIAGHSNKSYTRGTTRDYVGALEESMYNLRAEQQRTDRMAPDFAQEGPSAEWLQERASRHEIDDFMRARGMDLDDSKQRKRARVQARGERAQEWREAAKNQPVVKDNTPAQTTSRQPLRQRTAAEANTRSGKTSKEKHILHEIPEEDDTQKYFSRPALQTPQAGPTATPPAPTLLEEVSSTTADGNTSLLDPQLQEYDQIQMELERAALESLTDSVFLHTVAEKGVTRNDDELYTCPAIPVEIDAVDSAMLDDHTSADSAPAISASSAFLVPAQGLALSNVVSLNGNDFVRFFSRINIFQKQVAFDRTNEAKVREFIPSGNSRDLPTSFLYHCKQGCGVSLWCRQDINDHEVNCTGQPSGKPFKCQRPGCDKSYKNEDTLKSHVSDHHDFTPVACAQCPDKPDVLYNTKNELNKHRNNVHGGLEETFCPLQAHCRSQVKFTQKKLLKQHLRRQHHLTTEQIKEHVPDARKGRSVKGKKTKPKGWHIGEGDAGKEELQDQENSD
jgi:hypothetical protein